MYKSKFKYEVSFENRQKESARILVKYSDKIPIICEKANQHNLPDIEKNKYLVPHDITVGQFMYIIRQKIKLKPEEALYLFVGGKIVSNSALISSIYETEKDDDGFLYVLYSKENTFG
jgi:GABA(A) receptor-associated protein